MVQSTSFTECKIGMLTRTWRSLPIKLPSTMDSKSRGCMDNGRMIIQIVLAVMRVESASHGHCVGIGRTICSNGSTIICEIKGLNLV